MKTLVNGMNEPRRWNYIASFGQASLVTSTTGRVELLGGSPSDRAEAKEWISLFLHDAVLQNSSTPSNQPNPLPCRRRHARHTPARTFWSGCRHAAQELAMLLA